MNKDLEKVKLFTYIGQAFNSKHDMKRAEQTNFNRIGHFKRNKIV